MKSLADFQLLGPNASDGLTGPSLETPGLRSFYLHPGQLFVATEPTAVTTILGSCVAVCIWQPALGIGGINHYLLPMGSRTASAGARYGNIAIEQLLDRLERAGTHRTFLQAKVFGGACVLDAMRGRENHLGAKNVEVARTVLAEAGIPVISSHVGGGRGRKLVFFPHDGSALVKLL